MNRRAALGPSQHVLSLGSQILFSRQGKSSGLKLMTTWFLLRAIWKLFILIEILRLSNLSSAVSIDDGFVA